MDEKTRTELEAAAFRRLIAHLRERSDVQNIDLMNLAGFCRNCMSNWMKDAADAQGVALTKRMMWAGLETGSLQAAIELESHTQLFVRLTTQNFEEATRARKEGRPPRFED